MGDIIGCFVNLDDFNPQNNAIRFFKNGQDQGIAYEGKEVPPGIYFPAISMYMKGHVRVNFGPSFLLKPTITGCGFNPVSEVQPMAKQDRVLHEQRIARIKEERAEIGRPT